MGRTTYCVDSNYIKGLDQASHRGRVVQWLPGAAGGQGHGVLGMGFLFGKMKWSGIRVVAAKAHGPVHFTRVTFLVSQ